MKRFLPPLNSWQYYLLLAFIATFFLGPLGAVMGAFMLLRLGMSVGVQVFAGIIGSSVTFPYGPEGRHGGNYMQTMAASVADIGSLCVIIQAQAWLGLPEFDTLSLMMFVCCAGMFGIGIGMVMTPIVVDKMQLEFPSGHAVANILRALTDKELLKRSLSKLASGTGLGFVVGLAGNKFTSIGNLGLSVSTFGAGMMVGARIAVPSMLLGIIGAELTPWLRDGGYIGAEDPPRKIMFVVALGMILGASIIDLTKLGFDAVKQFRGIKAVVAPAADWQSTNKFRLLLWMIGWGIALFVVGTQVLALPAVPLLLAMAMMILFVLVNGIATGITDSNSISVAFVMTVFLLGSFGLQDVRAGLLCAAIPLVGVSVGVDMQQDRSTGWRLGTNRTIQFRYQVLGVFLGSVLCVFLAKFFMAAYPILVVNQFGVEKTVEMNQWPSAFTYKLVGILKSLNTPNPHFVPAVELGVAIGFVTELLRKLLKVFSPYQQFIKRGQVGFGVGFAMDAFFLPSPYASSLGGFLDLVNVLWFTLGGILASFAKFVQNEGKEQQEEKAGQEEMSTISLVGGGLIAGDTLASIVFGLYALSQAF